jgi:hypothetical protein
MSSSPKSESPRIDRREFLGTLAVLGGGAIAGAIAPNLVNGAAATPAVESPAGASAGSTPRSSSSNGRYLETANGFYLHNGKAVWGASHHAHWWGGYRGEPHGWYSDAGLSAALIRNDPGKIGPNRTEDLEKLADAMLEWGYPGFEHVPPLWYDRRRDTHSRSPQTDAHVVGPFLEMPWARSDRGQACDGLALYDLTKFNSWYFSRIKQFADISDRKGTILFFNFYNQHNLLESPAHYIDYPWRPVNCIQATGLPLVPPAANVFYDVSDPLRRQLHQQYIRHCLDNLRDNRNVVFLLGMEYTGPLSFMQFWFDTILDWEKTAGRQVHIGVTGTKDVVDAMLDDQHYGPRVGTIYMRYWFYNADGTLNAPLGGKEIPGRYGGGGGMTPRQVYFRTRQYRLRYPNKALVDDIGGTRSHMMAFLMAGGSMIVKNMSYAVEYPPGYGTPSGVEELLPMYNFVRNFVAEDVTRMRPLNIISSAADDDETFCMPAGEAERAYCIGEEGQSYLIYFPAGDHTAMIDLTNAPGTYDAKWVGPTYGSVFAYTKDPGDQVSRDLRAFNGTFEGGRVAEIAGLDWQHWLLWLKKRA